MSFDEFVGVDDDEGGSDVGEDVIFAVAFDEIAEDFRFVEDVHFAHVGMEFALGHLEGVLVGSDDAETSLVGVGLVLNALAFQGANRDAFEEGLS